MMQQRRPKTTLLLWAAILVEVLFLTPFVHGRAFSKAAVAAGTPEAVQAGVDTLRKGGNAVDAAAAVGFALMVTDPAMCSLAGRSQALILLSDGKIVGIDGATMAPGAAETPIGTGQGYKTASVPGSPAALEQMVAKYGKLPLRVVMQPAIALARDGFVINEQYERFFQNNLKSLKEYPGSAQHFLKADGSPYKKGDLFRQAALAKALELIAAQGSQAVYKGKIAAAILDDMSKEGGLITAADLARYKVLPGKIVEGNYRGHRIVSRGDQCNGASVVEMLQVLGHFPLSTLKQDDPAYLHIMAQAIYLGNSDEELADWKQVSNALADRRAREIDLAHALPVPVRAQKSVNEGETTHLSVMDESGMAVAMTQSIGPIFGTKVANPEFGFFYAYSYAMNDDPAPYKRDKTSQSPTIVFDQKQPLLVIGSAGSSRIPGSIVEVIVNVIDHHMSLDQALAAPRLFLTDENLRVETQSYPESTIRGLTELGYKVVTPTPGFDGYFGKVHAIEIDHKSGKLYSGFDPRGYGGASGI